MVSPLELFELTCLARGKALQIRVPVMLLGHPHKIGLRCRGTASPSTRTRTGTDRVLATRRNEILLNLCAWSRSHPNSGNASRKWKALAPRYTRSQQERAHSTVIIG